MTVAPLLRTSGGGKDGGANSACRCVDGKSQLRDQSMDRSHVSDGGLSDGCVRLSVWKQGAREPKKDLCWGANKRCVLACVRPGVPHRDAAKLPSEPVWGKRAAVPGDSEPSTTEEEVQSGSERSTGES